MNTKSNILSNTSSRSKLFQYWDHSPGAKKPIVREEGPFPIQGNIGSLVKIEARSNFKECGDKNLIGGSPNCTVDRTFDSDIYTPTNTCGSECVLSAPFSYGDQNFGLDSQQSLFTNSHALHAYENKRAASPGQGPAEKLGCYEWIPFSTPGSDGTCYQDQLQEYRTVGNWTDLKENKNLVHTVFNNKIPDNYNG